MRPLLQELQHLSNELHEVFKRDGMLISREKTEASAYRAWVSAAVWLTPQVTHADGSLVKESVAFKYAELGGKLRPG